MNRCSAWNPILVKIQNKLSSWKARLLSRAGRLTLIKSVLNSLPVYFMSLSKIPKLIALKIVKLQRRFLWGESSNGRMCVPSVSWSSIELPKELGGLGVGNILMKNLILLFKWWWRFSDSDLPLWKKILSSIYKIRGLKASSYAFSSAKDGVWHQLLSSDGLTTKIRTIVEHGKILKVGNGQSILFWQDRWCDIGPLSRAFPRLFALSLQSSCFIIQMWEWNDGLWVWHLRWRRALFDWEAEEVGRLENCIGHFSPDLQAVNVVSWRNTGVCSFPTKSITEKVYESSVPILSKLLYSWCGAAVSLPELS